jgi:hypothetical protein
MDGKKKNFFASGNVCLEVIVYLQPQDHSG